MLIKEGITMLNKIFLPVALIFLFCNNILSQQENLQHEISSNIQELQDFHEIIYPIWHTAFPAKDIAALKGYVPEVNKLADKIFIARLPGILREKEEKWKDGLEKFKKTVEMYNKAADENNDQKMLDAAEELHAKYEMLVRIIRPVLKEVDVFHQDLYLVYHHYFPDKDLNKIKEIAPGMVLKADAIQNATLPQKLLSRQNEFYISAEELSLNTLYFSDAVNQGDWKSIEETLNKMHTSYEKLEALFN
jgi:hypothetical protein